MNYSRLETSTLVINRLSESQPGIILDDLNTRNRIKCEHYRPLRMYSKFECFNAYLSAIILIPTIPLGAL